jgi:Na+/H+-dicarboxylate symporter
LFAGALAWPIFARLDLPREVSTSLISTSGASQATDPAPVSGFAQWIVALVPPNPIQAAADGVMLPLIVFALLLGLAVRRAGEEPSQAVLAFFHGIAESMFVLVRWTILVAPAGVFALATVLAARTGFALAEAFAYYIAVVVGLTVLFAVVVLYPLAAVAGRVPLRQFVRGTLPAQAVAFSSRSSLACLPAMVEGARNVLGLGEEITVFLVPLAGSIFRVGSAIAQMVGVLFLARLYDVHLDAMHLVSVTVAIVLTTFSVPGIPGGTIIAIASVLPIAGLPLSGIALLLGIDAIPDMFRTTANVTGGMTAAVVLARREPMGVHVASSA